MSLAIFSANAAFTLATMALLAWYLRRTTIQIDVEIKRRWETELVAMEASKKATQDFLDDRLALIERQLTLLEGRVDLIERWQRAARRQLEQRP